MCADRSASGGADNGAGECYRGPLSNRRLQQQRQLQQQMQLQIQQRLRLQQQQLQQQQHHHHHHRQQPPPQSRPMQPQQGEAQVAPIAANKTPTLHFMQQQAGHTQQQQQHTIQAQQQRNHQYHQQEITTSSHYGRNAGDGNFYAQFPQQQQQQQQQPQQQWPNNNERHFGGGSIGWMQQRYAPYPQQQPHQQPQQLQSRKIVQHQQLAIIQHQPPAQQHHQQQQQQHLQSQMYGNNMIVYQHHQLHQQTIETHVPQQRGQQPQQPQQQQQERHFEMNTGWGRQNEMYVQGCASVSHYETVYDPQQLQQHSHSHSHQHQHQRIQAFRLNYNNNNTAITTNNTNSNQNCPPYSTSTFVHQHTEMASNCRSSDAPPMPQTATTSTAHNQQQYQQPNTTILAVQTISPPLISGSNATDSSGISGCSTRALSDSTQSNHSECAMPVGQLQRRPHEKYDDSVPDWAELGIEDASLLDNESMQHGIVAAPGAGGATSESSATTAALTSQTEEDTQDAIESLRAMAELPGENHDIVDMVIDEEIASIALAHRQAEMLGAMRAISRAPPTPRPASPVPADDERPSTSAAIRPTPQVAMRFAHSLRDRPPYNVSDSSGPDADLSDATDIDRIDEENPSSPSLSTAATCDTSQSSTGEGTAMPNASGMDSPLTYESLVTPLQQQKIQNLHKLQHEQRAQQHQQREVSEPQLVNEPHVEHAKSSVMVKRSASVATHIHNCNKLYSGEAFNIKSPTLTEESLRLHEAILKDLVGNADAGRLNRANSTDPSELAIRNTSTPDEAGHVAMAFTPSPIASPTIEARSTPNVADDMFDADAGPDVELLRILYKEQNVDSETDEALNKQSRDDDYDDDDDNCEQRPHVEDRTDQGNVEDDGNVTNGVDDAVVGVGNGEGEAEQRDATGDGNRNVGCAEAERLFQCNESMPIAEPTNDQGNTANDGAGCVGADSADDEDDGAETETETETEAVDNHHVSVIGESMTLAANRNDAAAQPQTATKTVDVYEIYDDVVTKAAQTQQDKMPLPGFQQTFGRDANRMAADVMGLPQTAPTATTMPLVSFANDDGAEVRRHRLLANFELKACTSRNATNSATNRGDQLDIVSNTLATNANATPAAALPSSAAPTAHADTEAQHNEVPAPSANAKE